MSSAASITLHLVAFLGGCLAWGAALVVITTVTFLVTGGLPAPGETIDIASLGGTTTGVLTIAQIAGFAGWAVFLATMLPARGESDRPVGAPGLSRLRPHVGATSTVPWRLVGLALLGSLTVWTLPSWIASQLMTWFGRDDTTLVLIGQLLREGALTDRAVMATAVVLSAPLCEEVIFRGYLWEVTERWGGRSAAMGITTLLFAAYHLDAVHVLSLLPTALFLGYLRLVSGSLWPPLAAHFGNNAISTLVVVLQPEGSPDQLPLWFGLTGAAWTGACCILAWLARTDRRAP